MYGCSADLRSLGRGASDFEQAAGRIVRYLYDNLRDFESGERACALVRIFRATRLGLVPDRLRDLPRLRHLGADARCFVLSATRGELAEWNEPALSVGHRLFALE